MNIELMLGFQILADVVVCLLIIFLFRSVTREVKRGTCGVDPESLHEFKKLMEESRDSADYFLQKIDEGRKSIKEISYTLDRKEKRLKMLIEETETKFDEGVDRGTKYEQAIEMAGQGYAEKDIADALDLPEGEVNLILGLDRKKIENA